jgi:predicted HTH domain antitoxin
LTVLSKYEFGRLLGERRIPRQYDQTDLQDDVAYARGQ